MDPSSVHVHESLGASPELAPSDAGVSVAINVDHTFGALIVYGTPEQAGLEIHLRRQDSPTDDIHVWMLSRELSTGSQTIAAVFGSLEQGTYEILSPEGTVCQHVEIKANSVLSAVW